MEIVNVLSIIILLYFLYLLLVGGSYKERYIEIISFSTFIQIAHIQGYFIALNGVEIFYDTVVVFVEIIATFIFLKLKSKDVIIKVSRTYKIYIAFFIFIISLAYIYAMLVPYDGYVIDCRDDSNWDEMAKGHFVEHAPLLKFSSMALILLYVINGCSQIWVLKELFSLKDIGKIFTSVLEWGKILLVIVMAELISKNLFDADFINPLISVFAGENAGGVNTEMSLRNGLYMLQGVTREPSHLANSLFYLSAILIINTKIILKRNFRYGEKAYFMLINLFQYLSGSFTGIVYIFIDIAMLTVIFKEKNNVKYNKYKNIYYIIPIFIIIGLLMEIFESNDSYFSLRLQGVFVALDLIQLGYWKNLYDVSMGSALPRLLSIYHSALIVIERPLLGVGPGVECPLSGLLQFFCNFGIIAFFAWFKFCLLKFNYPKLLLSLFIFQGIITGDSVFYFTTQTLLVIESTRFLYVGD